MNVKDYIDSATKGLERMQNDYNDACSNRQETIKLNGVAFDARQVAVNQTGKGGESVQKNVTIYPTYNEEKKMVEYRDEYGNLYATQKTTTVNRNPDEVKVGKEYIIKVKNFWGIVSDRRIKVTEVRNGFGSFFRKTIFGGKEVTNKTIFYTYEENGETKSDSITVASLEQYKHGAQEFVADKMEFKRNCEMSA